MSSNSYLGGRTDALADQETSRRSSSCVIGRSNYLVTHSNPMVSDSVLYAVTYAFMTATPWMQFNFYLFAHVFFEWGFSQFLTRGEKMKRKQSLKHRNLVKMYSLAPARFSVFFSRPLYFVFNFLQFRPRYCSLNLTSPWLKMFCMVIVWWTSI